MTAEVLDLRLYQRKASAAAHPEQERGEYQVLSNRGRSSVTCVELILLGKTEEEALQQARDFRSANKRLRVALRSVATGETTPILAKGT